MTTITTVGVHNKNYDYPVIPIAAFTTHQAAQEYCDAANTNAGRIDQLVRPAGYFAIMHTRLPLHDTPPAVRTLHTAIFYNQYANTCIEQGVISPNYVHVTTETVNAVDNPAEYEQARKSMIVTHKPNGAVIIEGNNKTSVTAVYRELWATAVEIHTTQKV